MCRVACFEFRGDGQRVRARIYGHAGAQRPRNNRPSNRPYYGETLKTDQFEKAPRLKKKAASDFYKYGDSPARKSTGCHMSLSKPTAGKVSITLVESMTNGGICYHAMFA